MGFWDPSTWGDVPKPPGQTPGQDPNQPTDDGRRWYNMFDPMGLTPAGYHAPQAYLPDYQQNKDQLNKQLDGRDPFASGDWQGVIKSLQDRANGTAPSVAVQQYQGAQQDTANSLAGMAHGSGSSGALRQAAMQQGRVGQGMAQGSALARTQEMEGAQGQLGQALGQRDQLNQNAYLNLMAQKLGLSAQQMQALIANSGNGGQQSASQSNGIAGLAGGLAAIL